MSTTFIEKINNSPLGKRGRRTPRNAFIFPEGMTNIRAMNIRVITVFVS